MELVKSTQCGRVLRLHLNSPQNLNALSGAMINALMENLKSEKLTAAWVLLITAEGRHFCAGHDLAEVVSTSRDPALFDQCSSLMQRIAELEIPVVTAVQGCSFAAGCQLAASSDIVIATSNARFSTPGVKIGLFCSTPSVAVTRTTTDKIAADMLFSARELSANEALAAGLVSRVLPDGVDLLQEAMHHCNRIAATPRDVLVGGKSLLKAQKGKSLQDAYGMASLAMNKGMELHAAHEGISAFLEKRLPQWGSEDSEIAAILDLLPAGVAVVGASPMPSKPSHGVFARLKEYGPAYPVNPNAFEVCGLKAFSTLESVAHPFVVVNIFRSGPAIAEAVDEAIRLASAGKGVKAVWLQEGVRAPEAEQRARAAGLHVVADKCLAVERARRAKNHRQHVVSKL